MSIPPALQGGVTARLKVLASLDIAERCLPQDGRFSAKSEDGKIDLRVSTLPTTFGEKVVLRLLDNTKVRTDLRGLGFSRKLLASYEAISRRPCGTILVMGPTGSGKSTTLYATLGEINSAEKNIVTIENPVEYRIRGINQFQVNPRIGLTFPSGLRSILRSDPDVVMIGEIRDRDTAKTSVGATEYKPQSLCRIQREDYRRRTRSRVIVRPKTDSVRCLIGRWSSPGRLSKVVTGSGYAASKGNIRADAHASALRIAVSP